MVLQQLLADFLIDIQIGRNNFSSHQQIKAGFFLTESVKDLFTADP